MKESAHSRKGGKNTKKTSENWRVNLGFSIIEILIVVTIVALLIIAALFFFQRHAGRARDGQRKSDLQRLEVVFEEYYNDHRCYPPFEALQECGVPADLASNVLYPEYLKEIPCDPYTHQPYLYFGLNGDYCSGYRILTELESPDDTDITGIGCSYDTGCNYIYGNDYDYGVQRGWKVEGACEERDGSGVCIDKEWLLPDPGANYQQTHCILESGVAKCHVVTEEELRTKFDCPRSFNPGECCPTGGTCGEVNCSVDSPNLCETL